MHYDVFNGDADGLCALIQLRLAEPKTSQLITGVKRDISLAKQVPLNAKSATILDISFDKNSAAVTQLLQQHCAVFYVDHHQADSFVEHKNLNAIINLSADTCTSLLVNGYLHNEYAHWAAVGAFGDNLNQSATNLANQLGLTNTQIQQLQQLGMYLNYNGYGRDLSDLHFHPAELFNQLIHYRSPLELLAQSNGLFQQLAQGYQADWQQAQAIDDYYQDNFCQVKLLPDEVWARRISGVYSNELANHDVNRAHIILTPNADNSFTVSLRAPLNNKQGANKLCSVYASGGGRAAAAGINQLLPTELEAFIQSVSQYYRS